MTNATRTITVTSQRGNTSVETALTVADAVGVLRPLAGQRFAQDLIREYDRGRAMSQNKLNWLLVLAQEHLDRARQAAQAPRGERLTSDFASLTTLLQRARDNGLKYPRIRLQTETGKRVVLSLAGEQSRTPGAIQVTDGGRRDDNTWYGRISTDGRWQASRDATPDVVALLHAFAADPVRVATEHGRQTGECCFCKSDLTDERSTLVGYGPTCADRFGLPWGDRPARQQPVPVSEADYDRAFAAEERAAEERAFLSDPDFQRDFAQHNPPGLSLAVRELVGA